MLLRTHFFVGLLLMLSFSCQARENVLAIQLATLYRQPEDIKQYWLSEKLDGVRGYWDGKELITRQGNKINPPPWFTTNWPATPLDGELWISRSAFEATVSCVRQKSPDKCWKKVRFMIFDLPKHVGTFTERITQMQQIVDKANSPYLAMIEQFKCPSTTCLYATLDSITSGKGEGIMLHFEQAYYQPGRNPYLMKLKKYYDAEAVVLEHIPGKGKYQNMLGSLRVKTMDNIIFKIGTGFTNAQRRNPPEIGSTITYKYLGKTLKGVPRFASFVRIRKD